MKQNKTSKNWQSDPTKKTQTDLKHYEIFFFPSKNFMTLLHDSWA